MTRIQRFAEGGALPFTALIDEVDDAVGAVLLFHGFARKPGALDDLAGDLVRHGLTVLRPSLPSFRRTGGINDGDFIASVALRLVRDLGSDRSIVVCGHSAGGAAAAHAAAELMAAGVAVSGVVLIDANESLSGLLQPALVRLASVPVQLIAAAPSRCNRSAQVSLMITSLRSGFCGVQLVTGTHCDVEGERADLTCRVLCGSVQPANSAAVRRLASHWCSSRARGESIERIGLASDEVHPMLAEGAVRALIGSGP